LSSEVAGIVESIAFTSGQDVAAGQILVRLRAADDLARLQALRATAALDQVLLDRDKAQFEAQAISQATLDTDTANLKVALAQVAEQEAVAGKKFIRAPFPGRVGIRAVDSGQYVSAGQKLVTLQSLNPIYADFYVPQQDLSMLAVGQAVTVSASISGHAPIEGKIEAISPQVDSNTRNLQVRAQIDNTALNLLPGMYTSIDVTAGETRDYLLLPQAAVVYNPYGTSVFVASTQAVKPGSAAPGAKPDDALRVQQRFVTIGPKRGDQVAVLKGVQGGDLIVTSGQMKLKNGALVIIDNSVPPTNERHPNPDEQ
jgi:membrane fusion protein (multidrug efflux system)